MIVICKYSQRHLINESVDRVIAVLSNHLKISLVVKVEELGLDCTFRVEKAI